MTIFCGLGGILLLSVTVGCRDFLAGLNENPNGANPETTNPNLVLSTVLTQTGVLYRSLGYGDLAGVVQHTQKDGFAASHNNYDWDGSNSWDAYYDILRNNRFVLQKAEQQGLDLHRGVALVMKSYVFGLLADLWGDVPYSDALWATEGGTEAMTPRYDRQEDVYRGVLADLNTASNLLAKNKGDYAATIDGVDVFYGGDPAKWRRFANALMLRYYMRLSEKLPAFAKVGVERIAGDPAGYPLILTAGDDANMPFPGTNALDAWQLDLTLSETVFRRTKMAATLVEYMRGRNDPRLGIWAARVRIPIQVVSGSGVDEIVGGIRRVSADVVGGAAVNQNADFVGLPTAMIFPQSYNLSPDLTQGSSNPHVSWLNPAYNRLSGPHLKARLLSAAEVNFILAEAALKGWTVGGPAQTYYENAVKASFDAYGLDNSAYLAYINGVGVAFDGTVRQVIEQKWIASWTAASEAWFDWRRTGFPVLTVPPVPNTTALGPVLPVRFYYMARERELNKSNTEAAIANLEATPYTPFGAVGGAGNSAWSKPWLLQGTGKPW